MWPAGLPAAGRAGRRHPHHGPVRPLRRSHRHVGRRASCRRRAGAPAAGLPRHIGRPAGGAVSYTVSVSPVNGFTGDVSLTFSGLSESQASWSISPPVIAGGSGSAQLTVSTATSIAAGTYPLTITTTSGATTHSATATLVVTAPPDFSLSTTPASQNVVAGAGASYTVGVASL